MRRAALIAALLIPLSSHAFALMWPVDCMLGETCFIQNFVDHDVSSAAHDFTCGDASYDKHDGTDIRLRNLAAMRAGVAVKTAADGTVIGVRDGVTDASIRDSFAPDVAGRECGNGVRINHAEGYATQYCHLMNGSITVRTGQQVKAGDVLGKVGLSGQTEFPHLHISVWKDAAKIDPFTGGDINSPCSAGLAKTIPSLWASKVTYHPTALLNDGFATSIPDAATMRDTPTTLATIAPDSPALIYWIDLMNLRMGDSIRLHITAPDGSSFAEQTIAPEKSKAAYFGYVGKKNAGGALVAGTYTATMTLSHSTETPMTITRRVDVK